MARPREFEPDDALSAIKDAFWQAGYEGTSLSDIEAATGLKKQSLYRLFGGKRQMYLAALDHYEQNEIAQSGQLLMQAGTARQRFKRLFSHVIDLAVHGDQRGCFLCNASIDQATIDPATGRSVAESMERIRQVFMKALEATPPYSSDKRLRQDKAAELLASYFGLRVLIKAHTPEKTLRAAMKKAVDSI